ncbi:MAG TPA: S-layer homology domain-containing protein, partial [Clostridiaceae bacterium]|nr:S-layer homology domain-containing protein [Clostridiaceae bacterium]
FVKLLVNAFGLKAEFDDNFDDVSEKDFFYKEAGIAKALGLIKGYGDGKFGPNDKITREDMVVIISRMLDMQGKGFEETGLSELDKFADKGEIASYAKEILASFVKAGIIKGSGGYINPKGNTNRAEMAVILHRILTYYINK